MHTLVKFITRNRLPVPGIVFAALLCSATFSAIHAQDRFRLNQLVQTGTGSSPSLMAFRQGRDLIADEKWGQAERVFNEFIKSYPTDKNVDAAWYWLAFALKREGKFKETNVALEKLIKNHPKSSWINDARAMRVEIAPQLGAEGIEITQNAEKGDTDEVKILALQSLMTLDSQRGIEIATNILKPGSASSVRLKGSAMSLLGRYGAKTALPVLSSMARNESDPGLRKRAFSALAGIDDDAALEPLKEVTMTAKEPGIAQASVAAIGQSNSPHALAVLGEIAENGQLPTTTRKYAIAYISRRKGEPSVDELFKIYDSNPPNDIKRQVIAGFGIRKSPRSQEKLVQIAKTADIPELRLAAVSALISRGDGPTPVMDILLQLYDTEKSEQVRASIIEILARSQDKRAQSKLMDVARSTGTPIELRKTAIRSLGRSKDPEVLKFLEDLLR
jgi:HEAT repeat protein